MLRKKLFTLVISLCLVMTAIPFTAVAVYGDTDSGLMAHWTFDGSSSAKVGGVSIASENGITYTAGILGQAAVFDGSSSYIETAKSANLVSHDKFSISAWIYNADTNGENGTLWQLGRDLGWQDEIYYSRPYEFKLNNGSTLYTIMSNRYANETLGIDNQGDDLDWEGATLNGADWNLLTVTYDGSRIKQYIGKKLVAQYNYSDGMHTDPSHGLMIGSDEYFENYFKGMMDDLRIYNRVLAAADVTQLYEKGLAASKEKVEPSNKLVAHYTFDGDVKDKSSMGNDGEMVETNGNLQFVEGINGKALKFRNGNYVEIPFSESLNLRTQGTISFWAQTDNEEVCPILTKFNPATGLDNENEPVISAQIKLWGETNIEGIFIAMTYDPAEWSPSSSIIESYSRKGVQDNWHLYTFTFEPLSSGKIAVYFYIDGVLGRTYKSDETSLCNSSGYLLLGYNQDDFFNGLLDDVRIYNYALSTKEIKAFFTDEVSVKLSTTLAKKIKSIKKGKTVSLSKVNVGFADETVAIPSSKSDVKFKSSKTSVFTVTSSGKIKAKKKGTGKLTVSYGGATKVYTVKVS